jgi:carbonic anhydrase/acetyltransferase-like protein (isoleucine patch superfamily)
MINIVPILIISSIWIGAFLIAAGPYLLVDSPLKIVNVGLFILGIVLFVFFSTIIAGLISLLGQSGIKRGKFPRDVKHSVYGKRRIFGLCWTQMYYSGPIYSIILAIPLFRKIVFRLFGYRGSMDITLYPDTWIRDLPILKLSPKTYLSNKSTIGTNICLNDGSVLVDGIITGESAMVGHLVMLAPGCKIGQKSEVGVGCGLGIRSRVGNDSIVKPTCVLNHGASVGNNSDIGTRTYIGLKSVIGDNIVIPAGSNIPSGVTIMTQEDANNYYSSETAKLEMQKDSIVQLLMKSLNHGS